VVLKSRHIHIHIPHPVTFNLIKSRKKKRKANSPMSPLDTCSTPSTRNPGKASVEKVYTTSQADSTSHYVFKPDFSTNVHRIHSL